MPWVAPLARTRAVNDSGFEAGLDSGELEFAGYILLYKGLNDVFLGTPMDRLRPQVEQYLEWNRRVRNTVAVDALQGIHLALANLAGATPDRTLFATDDSDEASFIAACEANQTNLGLCYYYTLKTQILTLYGDLDGALAASRAGEALLGFIVGNVAVAEHSFHSALLAAALWRRSHDDAGRTEHRKRLDTYREQLAGWARECPENFAHMQALADAEAARIDGDPITAVEAYEQAISLALDNGFDHDTALANELLGRFWLERGQQGPARAYLGEAYYRYGAKYMGFSSLAGRGVRTRVKKGLSILRNSLRNRRPAEPRPSSREYQLWYHMIACESHRQMLGTALGILAGEIGDLRTDETRQLVDEMMPWSRKGLSA